MCILDSESLFRDTLLQANYAGRNDLFYIGNVNISCILLVMYISKFQCETFCNKKFVSSDVVNNIILYISKKHASPRAGMCAT